MHGQPAEWVTETEPEWDSDTRNWAFALADLEADTCPHGHRLSETAGDDVKVDDWQANFVACAACAAIEATQAAKSVHDEALQDKKFKTARDYPAARLWYAHKANSDN